VPLSNDVLLLCTCTIYTRTAQWLSRDRISVWTKNSSPLENARPTLETTKPPVQRVPELFPVGKASGESNAVAQLVEALRYKIEGRRFKCRWCHWSLA
jgi:hypothetical protein